MKEGPKESAPGAKVERTAEVIAEQQETVQQLSTIIDQLFIVRARLDKWGELADQEYLSEARGALNTLHHRLQDTERPR
mgnify:CR=1 FL=1